jgi:hypothetical protein
MKILQTVITILVILLMVIGLVSWLGSSVNILLLTGLLLGFMAWVLPRAARQVSAEAWIVTGLLILTGLMVPSHLIMDDREPGLVSSFVTTILFLLPSLALVNAALLLQAGLNAQAGRWQVTCLILVGVLVLKTLHNLYELTVWDSTYDALTYLWLIVPVCAVLLSAFMLFVVLPERTKLTGFLYVLVLPGLMIAASALAQGVDFRQVTNSRAERTARAIESYYAREGRYPETLSELAPRYLLSVPKPMIIYGQDWCYESGEEYFRLGYIDREHWSDPRLIGRVYKSAGELPEPHPMCLEEFNAIQNREPDYPYSYWKESQ